MELFEFANPLPGTPLSERLRPKSLDGFFGQGAIVAAIRKLVDQNTPTNMIFWGPPGTGKTTMAEIIATHFGARFVRINAVESGVKALREIVEAARAERIQFHKQTILFLDEIHRWSRSQQDVLLPYVEKGDIVLIGATTESPVHSLNPALLSRCRSYQFSPLSSQDLRSIIESALTIMGYSLEALGAGVEEFLITSAGGDARRLIQEVQALFIGHNFLPGEVLDLEYAQKTLAQAFGAVAIGEGLRHDLVSALIKSIRGSDADASLYYLARLIVAGEDPRYIARRLVILASEDIGNAEPRALPLAVAVFQAAEVIGLPEVGINLSHAVTFLASSPKSNRSYIAWKAALELANQTQASSVPRILQSSPRPEAIRTESRPEAQFSYRYPHDYPKSWVEQNYWPKDIQPQKFYLPGELGQEKHIRDYQSWLKSNIPR